MYRCGNVIYVWAQNILFDEDVRLRCPPSNGVQMHHLRDCFGGMPVKPHRATR